jgi:large subunit ribosomal protein L35
LELFSRTTREIYGSSNHLETKFPLAPHTLGHYIARSFWKIMRRPKGIKTRKSVAKRFKITARGKVLRRHAGKRHLLGSKNPKRRRHLRGAVVVDETDAYRITQSLPFTH